MVKIDQTKCNGCGRCVSDCVGGHIKLSEGKAEYNGPCIRCGHCVAICPSSAASIPEYDMQDVELYDKERFGFTIDRFLHTIKFRRSIRCYTNQPVEREKLEHMLQAGRYTATGANRQGCRFVIIQEGLTDFKEMIWSGTEAMSEQPGTLPEEMLPTLQEFVQMRAKGTDYLFRNAPAVIYVAAESTVDAAMAAQNMELAAIAQGLGILYNGFLVYAASFHPAACEWLDVKDTPIAVCMLVGYPQVVYQRTAPRRDADVRWR